VLNFFIQVIQIDSHQIIPRILNEQEPKDRRQKSVYTAVMNFTKLIIFLKSWILLVFSKIDVEGAELEVLESFTEVFIITAPSNPSF